METLISDEYVHGLIDAGSVPPVEGVEDQLEDTEHADFAIYTHELVSEASTFTQSWDQAISPEAAETMLTNLQLLFLGDVTPEEFADNMDGRV
jgi:raffinose/stachyose/melibiose transport system substrate-binding protein/xylobiose transport system substrate-binding protein